ncbi:hypothetical protein BDZ94DRAFT_1265986 [Collybia nuda]|uniref:RanBP2-type domain-containing protein n=1 Tax=Collybia nuda TaxID=64659 RepID=A0A9P5XZG8_9AGAR|nr:hypothetical protein BDZ94DRAFT_1265986 [Collybia nuda]
MLASSSSIQKTTRPSPPVHPAPIMNIPHRPSEFDNVLSRLQKLSLPSHSTPSLTSPSSSVFSPSSDSPKARNTLGAPFSMSCLYPSNQAEDDDVPTIIDTFAPRPLPYDLSPTSSASSDFDSVSSHSSFPRPSFDAFVATRSRVVRLYNLPALAEPFLSAVFLPQSFALGRIPVPVTMWTLRDEYSGSRCNSVWAVYRTHEEASAALALSGPTMSVTTALESDLEPFHKLRRFILNPPVQSASSHVLRSFSTTVSDHVSLSYPNLQDNRPVSDPPPGMDVGDYTISTNPPNPRTSFRQGDWICSSPKCAAHNFGRNLACIGCGCPRGGPASQNQQHQQSYPANKSLSSPRFSSSPAHNPLPPPPPQQPQYVYPQLPLQSAFVSTPTPPTKSPHPLLTPSGRAFAVGGKIQNISSDPLSPCIMYWPDNEPFPEQGQIRPSGLVGVPQPPILNTGNRGPISHQPGDWVCLKCNYLNWRRRKVCQTCLPYAEGNGDSISAAVQAERIALLTSVLAQAQKHPNPAQPSSQVPRSHSMTPPQQRRPFIDVSPPQIHAPVHRSHSHFELGTQYANSRPIYQTSGHRQPSPLYSTGPNLRQMPVHAPAPLLPSFLLEHESPTLSPTSTSSADLSFEEFDDLSSSNHTFPHANSNDDSVASSPLGNIWRLDGEESKSLSAFALPNRQDLLGNSRKNSREGLHLHS